MRTIVIINIILFLCIPHSFAQKLNPGFNKTEYQEMMYISARSTGNINYSNKFPLPNNYKLIYQSPTMGLDNLWTLWTSKNNVAVISIRGTTEKAESWLANFYAAMVPAKGSIQLTDTNKFNYNLANHPEATIHIGWLISTAYLSKDILPKLDSCYNAGIKDFIIVGHSQGGAIAYLLTAYLNQLKSSKQISSEIQFKTYCSAAPKPGNLYFAYEYEYNTKGNWAYNVVNSADWVPETPISIQTVNDFNSVNPFINAKKIISKQKFPTNLALKHVYNQLERPTRKAQKKYEKYLGNMTSKMVSKNLPNYVEPTYSKTNNYVRTGNTIVLFADDDYYKLYPNSNEIVFIHHLHEPYLYLLNKQYE